MPSCTSKKTAKTITRHVHLDIKSTYIRVNEYEKHFRVKFDKQLNFFLYKIYLTFEFLFINRD